MLVPIKEMGTVVLSLSPGNDRTIKAAELDQNNPKCNLRDIPKTQSVGKHKHHYPGILGPACSLTLLSRHEYGLGTIWFISWILSIKNYNVLIRLLTSMHILTFIKLSHMFYRLEPL